MRMNIALAFKNFDQRLQSQVAAWWDEIFFAGGNALVVNVPGIFVITGFGECAPNRLFNAHSSGGIALRLARHAEIRAFGIFPESEFDSRQRAFQRQFRSGLAPTTFDHRSLTADCICAAVKNIRSGHASGEIAIDVNVSRIENLCDICDRRNRDAALVHSTFNRNMRMAIDDSRHHELACRINDCGILGSFQRRTNLRNFAILNENGPVFNRAMRDGKNSRVLYENYGSRLWRHGHCECSRYQREHCREHSKIPAVHRTSPWSIDEFSASELLFVGRTPVKSIEMS